MYKLFMTVASTRLLRLAHTPPRPIKGIVLLGYGTLLT